MSTESPSNVRIELTCELTAPEKATLEVEDKFDALSAGHLRPPVSDRSQCDSDNEEPPMQTRLVRATRQGDSVRVAKLLNNHPDIDVSSTDTLGRSALRMAVKMDHLEVVETLINRASPPRVIEALLLSIALGHDQISETIIHHKVYKRCKQMMKVCTLQRNVREVESVLEQTVDDSLFSSDITPLILAAQKNQYEIVRLLLSKGEKIREPCSLDCGCLSCLSSKNDELRYAATRLHTYKALASEAYISLQSKDPLLTAFEMAHKLRKRSMHEGYFRSQYLMLADNMSQYAVKLLDKVRDGQELRDVLDDERGKLGRLSLAIQYKEKIFVTHPSCQKKLVTVWLGDIRLLQHLDRFWKLLLFAVCLTICYPFMAICYLLYPWNKIGRFLTVPMVKCCSMACSYIVFVVMAVVYSITERPTLQSYDSSGPVRLSMLTFLQNNSLSIYGTYKEYTQSCSEPNSSLVQDVYIRNDRIGYGTWVMLVWLAGLIWQSCKRMYHDDLSHFMSSWYNRSDFLMYACFLSAFTLRVIGMTKTSSAIAIIRNEDTWKSLLTYGCIQNANDTNNIQLGNTLYLINADRRTWNTWDIYVVFEALHAIGNILVVCRLSFIFALHPHIGPLLQSLSSMIRDVFVFMFVFALIVLGFFMGFNTLFWYHSPNLEMSSNTKLHESGDTPKGIYATETFDLIFWSIFGMVDKGDVKFLQKETVESDVTRTLGVILFALYNWITVLVLITMLIAMMARSYDMIADDEDVQWKFSRSSLYMDFIKPGFTLCVPFNLIPSTKSICYLARRLMYLVQGKRTSFHVKQQSKMDSPSCGSVRHSNIESPFRLPDSGDVFHMSSFDLSRSVAGQPERYSLQTPYEFTMRCIVERFVAQATNKTEEKAGKDQTKADEIDSFSKEISNIRADISNSWKLQEQRNDQLEKKINKLDATLTNVLGISKMNFGKGQIPSHRRRSPQVERQSAEDRSSVQEPLEEIKDMLAEILQLSAHKRNKWYGEKPGKAFSDSEHSVDLQDFNNIDESNA